MNPTRDSVLMIEDEPQIRRFVRAALEGEGFEVHEATTVKDGLAHAAARRPRLVVLDLGLPDGDGVAFLRDLRSWSDVPVIVLSARSAEGDKIAALDAGADDYLTKPFSVGELLARVRAAVRRAHVSAQASESSVFAFGEVSVDLAARRVLRGGAEVHLTPTEYQLLTALIAEAGKVLTHRHLLRAVWGPAYSERTHYLRVYMGNLRNKLEADAAQPRHLLTETGVGYRLVAD